MTDLAYDRLDESRKELLDLSFRNALLNYRLLRSRGVDVRGAMPAQVYKTLVADDKKMSFAAAETEPTGSFDTVRIGFRETSRKRHAFGAGDSGFVDLAKFGAVVPSPDSTDVMFALDIPPSADTPAKPDPPKRTTSTLSTPHSARDLQSRLLNTYYTARTFLEEQGVNTLYVTLGSLVWYEDDKSDQVRVSPLVLIPVDIERAGVGGRFQISYRDEEVGDNMSLAAYLANNFGLTLPDLPETDDIDLDDYFAKVEAVIHPSGGGEGGGKPVDGPALRARWRVDRSAVTVGFFSFSKYQMYKDLEAYDNLPNAEPHPIIQALLGEGFREPDSQYTDNENLDDVMSPKTSNIVIDCDGTQALAILDVAAGRNMVIQGPPGTGKSQTITNIIADAIGRGKRVLFVAEKSAALAVVRDRLDRLELGHCCLELHSNKTNKKAVLRDLQSTLELGRPVVPDNEDSTAMLVNLQKRLNEYCDAVNGEVGQSSLTPYDVFGECLTIDAASPDLLTITMPNAAAWSALQYREREQLVAEIQAQVNAIAVNLPPRGVIAGHPFWGSHRTTCLPADVDRCRDTSKAAADATVAFRDRVDVLAEALGLDAPVSPDTARALVTAVCASVDAPPHVGVVDAPREWFDNENRIELLLQAGLSTDGLRKEYAGLTPTAWTASGLEEVRRTITEFRGRWWRFLSPRWHQANKASLALWQRLNPTVDEQLAAIDAVAQMQRHAAVVEKERKIGERFFATVWQGADSDWPALNGIANWLFGMVGDIADEAFTVLVKADLRPHALVVKEAEAARDTYAVRAKDATDVVRFDAGRRFGAGATLDSQSFSVVAGLFASWTSNAGSLREMSVFNVAAEKAGGLDIMPVVDAAAKSTPGGTVLVKSFRRSYLAALLNRCFEELPAFAGFAGKAHDEVVSEFRRLDLRLLSDNRAKLARLHWDNLPSTNGEGQVRILRREFEKKSRHLALRRLLSDAGRAVQAIKPVFMMSPLSVATYLAPHMIDFDLVVFDEASQVRPVDAFGALLRGRQAVVVGDSKQLPPTAFFDTITSLDLVAEDSVVNDVESVLGLFLAQGAPQRTLRWHYRSRHESLIAISNEEFYENKLVIFPSPDSERRQYGLYYHQLPETVYDRGKSSTNRLEAKAVAAAVMAHATAQIALPAEHWHSLGVAAFSMGQMQAIIEEVEALRRTRPECEPFFATGHLEPFFVKNLESVQGDERDVIYISVGYGRDADGKVSMNFGPLNGAGGERRLNVLITRARLRCEVFTNLSEKDLRTDESSPRGIVAFKRFLAFARTGVLDSPASTTTVDQADLMLDAIRTGLTDRGYSVAAQVGCAGYYVDIAVRDPADPSRYLVAVECDGPNYRSAHSSRDRDRLREHVLRSQGWQAQRVWSTDWVGDPRGSLLRLIQAIEDAKRTEQPLGDVEPDAVQSAPDAVVRVQAARAARTVAPYACAELAPLTGWNNGAPPAGSVDIVTQIVTVEGPVHVAEIARRIADAAGISRVTDRLRAGVETVVGEAAADRHITRRGDFCWTAGVAEAPLRSRAYLPAVSRKMDYVAPEEIDAALRYCLAESYGMTTDDLIRACGRALGFERLSEEYQDVVEARVNSLELAGLVVLADGRVRLL